MKIPSGCISSNSSCDLPSNKYIAIIYSVRKYLCCDGDDNTNGKSQNHNLGLSNCMIFTEKHILFQYESKVTAL